MCAIGIWSTWMPSQGASSGNSVNVPLAVTPHAVTAAEPALVLLLPGVHVAAAAPHRVEDVAVLAVRAGAVGRVDERLRRRALHRRRVLHAEVVPRLLHQHHAARGGVEPGVLGGACGRAERGQSRPAAARLPAAEVPEVVVRAGRQAWRRPAPEPGRPPRVAGRRGRERHRADDRAGDVLRTVRVLLVVAADRALVGGEVAGVEHLLRRLRVGEVDAAPGVEEDEGERAGRERRAVQESAPARFVPGGARLDPVARYRELVGAGGRPPGADHRSGLELRLALEEEAPAVSARQLQKELLFGGAVVPIRDEDGELSLQCAGRLPVTWHPFRATEQQRNPTDRQQPQSRSRSLSKHGGHASKDGRGSFSRISEHDCSSFSHSHGP